MTALRYCYFIYAYFPCNGCGVRVGVRKTRAGAERFAQAFAKRNRVETGWKLGRS